MTNIAIDMGGTNLRVGLIDNGVLQQVIRERCNAGGTEDQVLQQIFDLTQRLMTPQVERIGIAVPSIVDFDRGIVYDVMNIPSWKEVHLKEKMERRFGIPVTVDNDVNCFVKAEHTYGEGRGYSHVVGITLGTGVGAGIITNGTIYRGSNTGAGEICCLPYLDSNYEAFTSSQLFDRWGTTGETEAMKADKGDAEAIARWHELGYHLGKLLQVILYTYDPECIVIGGGIAQSAIRFRDAMEASMRENFQYPHEIERVKIAFSTLADCNLLGA